MDEKNTKSVEKWQLILQWICAAIWIVIALCDLIFGQALFLTILQGAAALCYTASALILTKRYRRGRHD